MLYRWSKRIDPEEENLWETRLLVDGVDFSIEKLIHRKRARISSFCETRAAAEQLKSVYGGGVTSLSPDQWEPAIDPGEARVLRIRDRFIVSETDDPEALEKLAKEHPGRQILSFPPQLAFGTGGHPTTANCLRLLVDAARARTGAWNLLDLGCGSGILSVAGARLGAEKTVAVELDPVAIGYAARNAARHEADDAIDFLQEDAIALLESGPEEPFDVVTANLFSELLIRILPLLDGWLKPGGSLILSGFLTSQTKVVSAKAAACGYPLQTYLRRGKWVAASNF